VRAHAVVEIGETITSEPSALCSVCDDGGDINQVDGETLQCRDCGTTWAIDGTNGERPTPVPPSAPSRVTGDDTPAGASDKTTTATTLEVQQ
jgi:hypothetical protein